jgi:serine/threonine protein kinase
MTCLTFDGFMVLDLLKGLASLDPQAGGDVNCDIAEWCNKKNNAGRKQEFNVGLDRLEKVTFLGSGSYGDVFLTKDSKTKKLYALKRLSKGHVKEEQCAEQICWERDLMTMLDSPFVVKLVTTYKDKQFVYLLMEACLGGDLYKLLRDRTELFNGDYPRGSSMAFYAACIAAGLEHLHDRRIVYRDLKPENILLDTAGYAKLCDMGLARFVCGKSNTRAGTPEYMAPEVINPPHFHDSSADWWSFGCVLFELLTGQTPFDDEGLDDAEQKQFAIMRSQEAGLPIFPFGVPHSAQLLVSDLLQLLPNRLGADGGAPAVRRHCFFTKLNFDFEALHHRTLPSPTKLEWREPPGVDVPQRFTAEGPDIQDELFLPYLDDGTVWDRDF